VVKIPHQKNQTSVYSVIFYGPLLEPKRLHTTVEDWRRRKRTGEEKRGLTRKNFET